MAIKISALPDAGVLDGSETIPVVKSGVTSKTAALDLGGPAITAHVAEADPHTQYLKESDTKAFPVFADDPLFGTALVLTQDGTAVLKDEPGQVFPVFADDPLFYSGAVLDSIGAVVVSGPVPAVAGREICAIPADGLVYAVSPTRTVKISTPLGVASSPQSSESSLFWLDGSSYRTMTVDGAAQIPQQITDIVFIPMLGQSKVVGATATAGAVTTTSPSLGRAFTFSGGAHPMQEADCVAAPTGLVSIQDDRLGPLIPHVERVHGPLGFGETPGAGIVFSVANTLPATTAIVFGTFGVGSASISQLSSASNPFKNMIRAAERVKAWCDLTGRSFSCPVLAMDQGEGDIAAATSPSTYTAALLGIQYAFEAAIDAIAGASANRPIVMPQVSCAAIYGNSLNTLVAATLDTALANPTKLKISHPQYFSPYFDSYGVHMTPLGYRIEGEYDGRSIAKVIAGADTSNLLITAAGNSSASITITTNADTQLVLDTTLCTDPGQYGLVLRKVSDDSDIALSAISISGSNQIVATALIAPTPGQDYYIGSAYYFNSAGAPHAGPTTGHRTNFRDSSVDVLSDVAGGASKYNWLAIQKFQFTAL